MKNTFIILCISLLVLGCSSSKIEKKGFQVSEITQDEDGKKVVGLPKDSLNMETQPRNVFTTKSMAHRITPIYKVNYHKKTGKAFTGSNSFHTTWFREKREGYNWNGNFMPGFSAIYGYNLLNVSLFNNETQIQTKFFTQPVLINTLYYPADSKDSIHYQPVNRDFFMVSVYNEDSNNDGFINRTDLRRLVLFGQEGINKGLLIPSNYSVMNSEYDEKKDYMYVFARLDQNKNGQMDRKEPIHIFWIDLKDPKNSGVLYEN